MLETETNFVNQVSRYLLTILLFHSIKWILHIVSIMLALADSIETRMWANAQPDGRPAEHRWRPLFNAAKFG